MIWLALLAAEVTTPSIVVPEEFRRKAAFQHMCITDKIMEDTGYKELGLLNIERGGNLPNFALVRAQKDRPALFEKGLVTEAFGKKNAEDSWVTAKLIGERDGRPANLDVTLKNKTGDGMAVTLVLTQDGRTREFRCFPHLGTQQPK